jgi:benzoylformate decarboxylase
VCKWVAEINHARDVPQALRRAFKVANEPPEGPVFLSLPMDTLDDEAEVDIVPTSYTYARTRPDPTAVQEIAHLLLEAEQPMLLLGDGVARSQAQPEAVAVAELLGAGMLRGYSSEFIVPASHPLNVGSAGVVNPKALRSLLDGCDVLLAVGTPVFRFIFPEPVESVLPAGARLIHIDLDTWEIGKNMPPALGVVGDPGAALADVLEVLRDRQTPAQAEAAQARKASITTSARARRERAAARARQAWDATPINPSRLMHELKAVLPDNGLVFAEAITNQGPLEAALGVDEPDRLLNVRGGGIGPGLPGTLGAQLARPDRTVIGVCSDGAAMYSISSLWTAAHHRIPVTYVMLNNASYRILKLNLRDYLGEAAAERRFVEMDLNDPPLRFDRMAESMGVRAWRVEQPDAIGEALRAAIQHPGPSLVDVVIDGGL